MNNNDILRRLRYAFDFSNKATVELFQLDPQNTQAINQTHLLALLAKEDDDDFIVCTDTELSAFLDGLIISKRGPREPTAASNDKAPTQKSSAGDSRLTRNDILKKLRIAMNFREQKMLDTLALGGSVLSKSELGALFRKQSHKHYRACGNQVLRNFIKGLTAQQRPEKVVPTDES